MTYNCNGLRDKNKLKRLIIKLGPFVKNGGIVLLQETHITDTKYLSMIWKEKFVSNCVKTNSAGVITLFKQEYEVLENVKDLEGRSLIIVIKNNDTKLIISNAYFPNDHKLSIAFAETKYLKILEMQHKYPDYLTVAAGDYNVCMMPNDSLNRNRSNNEKCLADAIVSNNRITNLVDSYRSINPEGGYTWKRGDCYSRLDYIFISGTLVPTVSKATLDWHYESSDHAAVTVVLRNNTNQIRGPGIPKINTNILNDPSTVKQVESEINEMLSQANKSWNPHVQLEFLKVVIRSVFAGKTSVLKKKFTSEITELEEEANDMEELKISILETHDKQPESLRKIQNIDEAILAIRSKIATSRKNQSNQLTFKSKTKWFEYGEKSNKFFLNLQKSRQNQNLITSISDGDNTYVGQKEVTDGIKKFYTELYAAKPRQCKNDNFYENCPKLTGDQAKFIDNELTLNELYKALQSCKDSSPGPDGIPYIVYKHLWRLAGPIILESWKYSSKENTLPQSHYESIITILPKEGKDIRQLKNWRPITLSNCDAKIITKALATKLSKVLEPIIDKSQTAYIPGRSVADNLRSNFFTKKYCRQNNLNTVLISLDAKKAFDSVDHQYIEETLRAYGFGKKFIDIFKLLYKNITARILVNGFQSESIKIERGVKQGDALSCAIFILCIDPLLRNINKSKNIKGITIRQKNNDNSITFKAGAYADDVSVMCMNENESIQGVFNEYSRLTNRSGLELNAEKTEILQLNSSEIATITFKYNAQELSVQTVTKMKICGLYYCTINEEEYELNVKEKIKQLSYKIKLWTPRNLTMEGKILIVKTYGLSQLIYNMQSYGFKEIDLIETERIIFKFIWSTSESQNGIDRISRATMKNEFDQGGMNVTDVECLDRALKLRQFIRAQSSNHVISEIQKLLTKDKTLKQEYSNITSLESICSSSQETINIIINYNRDTYQNLTQEEVESDRNLIDEVASINLKTYLERKGRPFHLCILKQISKVGITTLGELSQAYEHETNHNLNKAMEIILGSLPDKLTTIAKCFNENVNDDKADLKSILVAPSRRNALENITAKEFQIILKKALKRIESPNFNNKLNIDFDSANITQFRKSCKNAKLRNIYFRLIHKDFFTYSRMKRYKMTNSDKCPRCGNIETIEHLLWECIHAQQIWAEYNAYMSKNRQEKDIVVDYGDIYKVGMNPGTALIKIRVIQESIQKIRPTFWTTSRMNQLVEDLLKIECYIGKKNHTTDKFHKNWFFLNTSI
jgi:exonuclease III